MVPDLQSPRNLAHPLRNDPVQTQSTRSGGTGESYVRPWLTRDIV